LPLPIVRAFGPRSAAQFAKKEALAGTQLLVFGSDGNVYIRTNVIYVTTWAARGSSPQVARWQLVDALS
jgi:hypothetical protein